MANPDPTPALERIDAALARIEAANARRSAESQALRHRHHALKTRMAEAVAALDDVLGKAG